MSQAKCDELAMNINSQLTKHVSNLITWLKRKQKERDQQAASVQGCQAQDIGPLQGQGQGTEKVLEKNLIKLGKRVGQNLC